MRPNARNSLVDSDDVFERDFKYVPRRVVDRTKRDHKRASVDDFKAQSHQSASSYIMTRFAGDFLQKIPTYAGPLDGDKSLVTFIRSISTLHSLCPDLSDTDLFKIAHAHLRDQAYTWLKRVNDQHPIGHPDHIHQWSSLESKLLERFRPSKFCRSPTDRSL
ncbi:hypothetical protein BC832DRAFT_125466 [Gaertneriomyces semiglobifer]|nr:hypothetical protein BC832DRAFT_125466 [Gaertneriomyces semiglobifer]